MKNINFETISKFFRWVCGFVCGKYFKKSFKFKPISLKLCRRSEPVLLADKIKPYKPFDTPIGIVYAKRFTSERLEFPELVASKIVGVQNMQNCEGNLFKLRIISENDPDYQKFENIENRDKHSKRGLITNSNGKTIAITFEDLKVKLNLQDLEFRTLEPGKHSNCHCIVTKEEKQELLQQLETFKDSELWWWNNLGFLCGSAGFVILKDDVAIFTKTVWRS